MFFFNNFKFFLPIFLFETYQPHIDCGLILSEDLLESGYLFVLERYLYGIIFNSIVNPLFEMVHLGFHQLLAIFLFVQLVLQFLLFLQLFLQHLPHLICCALQCYHYLIPKLQELLLYCLQVVSQTVKLLQTDNFNWLLH